jgi:hypothetical protein
MGKRTTTRTTKAEVRVSVDIRPAPASPAQKAAWHKLFTRLVAECQRELKAENEAKK